MAYFHIFYLSIYLSIYNVRVCCRILQKVLWWWWWWVVGGMLQLQCLLRFRPPESEIEIELERIWEASRVDLEMIWTRVWQLGFIKFTPYSNQVPVARDARHETEKNGKYSCDKYSQSCCSAQWSKVSELVRGLAWFISYSPRKCKWITFTYEM